MTAGDVSRDVTVPYMELTRNHTPECEIKVRKLA
jgi:hypothetical protein